MTSTTDEPTTAHTYELTCTDCAFETSVEGSFLEALDVADAHQEKHGDPLTKHFVNLKRSDTSE